MDIAWQGTVDIDAPLEKVYTYLADFSKHPEWSQSLERKASRAQSDSRHASPRPQTATNGMKDNEITELAPNSRIAWRVNPRQMGFGFQAKVAFDFASLDGNKTRLTHRVEMHQPWLWMQIYSKFVFRDSIANLHRKTKEQWQASLNNIKAIMEEGV